MKYQTPGNVDNLDSNLLDLWNKKIQLNFDRQSSQLKSKYFKLNFEDMKDPIEAPIKWFANPAEPEFCQDIKTAKELSNWGVIGRHNLHNEYCEYALISKRDKNGKLRPKRIQFTTELREYYALLAEHSPNKLQEVTSEVLGFQTTWKDLYGVDDPLELSENERKVKFAIQVIGHGHDEDLKKKGVPAQPIGNINREYALCMSHPINGLDDLLYIVMFGAHPYAINKAGVIRKATKEEIFKEFGVEHLACRHADPAAAMGAYDQVFTGSIVGFANPLGMYIHTFNANALSYNDDPIPDSWVKFSRGNQRLEIGPNDDKELFLDDIKIEKAGIDIPLIGGYDLSTLIEVGPNVLIESGEPISEHKELKEADVIIACNEASVCGRISKLKDQYDSQNPFTIPMQKFSFRQIMT